MGMSSTEWSRYMHDSARRADGARRDLAAVVAEARGRLPRAACRCCPAPWRPSRALAERWPLGLASSANRPLIDLVLELTGLAGALPRHRLLRGGAARQAGARRLPRGGAAAGRRSGALRRGRGLDQRDPLRERRRDAGGRDPAAGLPAVGRSARLADAVLDSLAELVPALERARLSAPGTGASALRSVERRLELGLEASLRHRADHALGLGAVAEQDQGRDREDVEPRRRSAGSRRR